MSRHVTMHDDRASTRDEKVSQRETRGLARSTRNVAISAAGVSRIVVSASGPFEILRDITLDVGRGEIVGIVGPSGGGKTTFLNIVAGLEPFSGGALVVEGAPPTAGAPDVAYAFARDALLPWRTALENVELALRLRRIPKREWGARALDALTGVGLADFADTYRAQLSQGMRQRVALARTFVTRPSLLLLDEPFAALDSQTRVILQDLLLSLLGDSGATALLITHDLAEAITIADRVVLFSNRPATVRAIYDINLPRPRSAIELRSDPTFQRIFETIWQSLGEEVTS